MEYAYFVLTLVPLAALSYANGGNDVSKSVATLAGAGATSLDAAIRWGTVFSVAGVLAGLFWGGELIRNITGSFFSINGEFNNMTFALAVAVAPCTWVTVSTMRGWPVSTTHSIVGSLIGAGVVAYGTSSIAWSIVFLKIVVPLLFSPVLAVALAFVAYPTLIRVYTRLGSIRICAPSSAARPALSQVGMISPSSVLLEDNCILCSTDSYRDRLRSGTTVGPDALHWLTSGLLSFARALNDAPKLIAITAPIAIAGGAMGNSILFAVAATAMGIGSLISGRRVTKVLGFGITPLSHDQGFAANALAAFLVIGASRFGLPVSTTHVSASAIMGTGLVDGTGVKWAMVRSMLMAWFVTLPASATIAAAVYGFGVL